MGAWRFMWAHYGPRLLGRFDLKVIARPEMTTPAGGSAAAFRVTQEQLLARVFGSADAPAAASPGPAVSVGPGAKGGTTR